MYNQSRPQFGLKPCRFGWHDVSRVGNIHELFHRDGVESEGNFHFTVVDASLQLFESAYSADEVDAFVAAKVFDTQNIPKYQIRRNRNIEHADGIAVIVSPFSGRERVPFSIEIKREIMQGAGVIYLFPFFLYDEVFCQLGKKFFFAQAVQVFHHAIVIYDMQLRGGKAYGKEIVIFLVSSVMGILAGFLCSDQSGGGGTVMSVGNIEIGNGANNSVMRFMVLSSLMSQK